MKEEQIKLFEKWRPEYKNFIPDGIVDERAYLDSPIKILYLLKEVNGGENWDLCEFLKNGGRGQTWNNITRWTIGIYQPDTAWSEIEKINFDNETRKEILKKICVVNVKKESGKGSSNNKELATAVERDKDRLKKQLAIYEPDFILCCGTGWLYEKIYEFDNAIWKSTSNGIKFFRSDKTVVIAYSHPQKRATKRSLYEELTDAVKEIQGKNKTA